MVVPTSGSTGEPKGVVLTHDAVAASARAVHRALGIDPTRHRWLSCLPLAHVAGLAVVMRGIVTGTPVVVHGRFDAGAVEAAARAGATHASLVPTALRRIDPAQFERIVVGGSAPPADLPPNVVASYAMTETGSTVAYDGVPLDGVELRIVDGEVQVRGPMLLRAYRDGVDPKDPEGWLATGDAGELDEAGVLRVHGRTGDVIVSGGEKVWPVAVEEVLRSAPGVADVAVAGAPDPEWGHRVVAHVVPADPGAPPRLDALRDHVRATLPAYSAPRALVLHEQLPRTALGKIRRGEL
ncbi:MAG: AMP-binding protein [Microthrixaceae bacterium]|nr:AMP-binding protein [Microthrixaceae bacterium]